MYYTSSHLFFKVHLLPKLMEVDHFFATGIHLWESLAYLAEVRTCRSLQFCQYQWNICLRKLCQKEYNVHYYIPSFIKS